MTARAFEWRQAPPRPVIEEAPPPPSLFDALDAPGFLAALGPSLARLAGCRITARTDAPGDDPAAGQWWQVARISAIGMPPAAALRAGAPAAPRQPEPGGIMLMASPGLVALLAELLFGGLPAAASQPEAQALPPGSATFAGIARQLSAIAMQAMRANGLPLPPQPPEIPARPTAAAIPHGAALLPLSLALEGGSGRLLLADTSCIPASPDKPPPDPRVWRRLARSHTMDVDLPVALRLEDMHLPLARVSALRPGDIIPISRPRQLAMMVGGQRVGAIAAERIAGPAPNVQEKP